MFKGLMVMLKVCFMQKGILTKACLKGLFYAKGSLKEKVFFMQKDL